MKQACIPPGKHPVLSVQGQIVVNADNLILLEWGLPKVTNTPAGSPSFCVLCMLAGLCQNACGQKDSPNQICDVSPIYDAWLHVLSAMLAAEFMRKVVIALE